MNAYTPMRMPKSTRVSSPSEEVLVVVEGAGLGDQDDGRAAELEIALLVALSMVVARVGLDNRPHAEGTHVDKPEVAERGMALQNLALVV